MRKVDPLLSLARDMRVRAREVSAKAETMQDADARQKMREIAAGYERLARRLETAAGGTRSSVLSAAYEMPCGKHRRCARLGTQVNGFGGAILS
jgi:hypothetical protein